MLKQILIAVILSALAVLCLPQLASFLQLLAHFHHAVANFLANYIHGSYAANTICAALALLLIPLVIAGIPAFIYWISTKRMWHYFPHVFWIVWVLLLAVLV